MIKHQKTKTQMSKEQTPITAEQKKRVAKEMSNRDWKDKEQTIIDKEELDRCKNDEYYFFKKYILINGKEPLMTREQFYELISSWNIKTKQR